MTATLHLVPTITAGVEGELLPAGDGPLLTRAEAQALTASIRRNLRGALEGLRVAREGRAWAAMGYPTYFEWAETEFGSLADLALPVVERQALALSMRTAQPPMSTRVIGERLGVSASTVSADLRGQGPSHVRGRDGVLRPARSTRKPQPAPEPAPQLSRADQVVALVAASGADGRTCRELEEATGLGHGVISGALSRVARQYRVRPTTARRQGCSGVQGASCVVYVVDPA